MPPEAMAPLDADPVPDADMDPADAVPTPDADMATADAVLTLAVGALLERRFCH